MTHNGGMSRYGRHLALPGVGPAGQAALGESSVLLVGLGGLGVPAATYLAAAGVGRIGLVDFDTVDISNLQRQVLYGTADVGRAKVDVAVERLKGLNPDIVIVGYRERLTSSNAHQLVSDHDIVIDGTDNFQTRYTVNDTCVHQRKPNVYGSVFQFEGQVSVFGLSGGPCYRCLFPSSPPPNSVPDCAEGGVLGILPGVIGTIQATEALKLILGIGEPLVGRLLMYDALSQVTHEVRVDRDPSCPLCGDDPTMGDMTEPIVTAKELAGILGQESLVVIDVREPYEHDSGHIPGSQNIPLDFLELGIESVPADAEIVVYCHSGGRSQYAVSVLQSLGRTHVRNLVGGIVAWNQEISEKR